MLHVSHGNHRLNKTRIETVAKALRDDEKHHMNVATVCMASPLCVVGAVIEKWTHN
ncbi:hypothetical protein DPMN_149271 [Dreissena polymorpha]|uniref:Uncharacterized protein n=1 Tax=Dreissena polymorpha TaxID=45954 RepID=A0A9D4FB26_DREPO|nr:hypothetical protein DPMN_149271 [Dreissena polymorpha]